MKRRPPKPSNAKPARSALVEIEKPIYGGAFLARMEGKATFVPLTMPGEEARVRIVEEKRSFATAEPEEIVRVAPERVVPHCRHFGACGGCHYQHANYEAQLKFKQAILRETLERGGVRAPETIEVLAGNPWQYRNRIRLAMDAAGRVGYRARRSHDLVPIAECPIAAPLLVKAALHAEEILKVAKPGFRAREISLFSNADETEMLASMMVPESGTRGFDRVFDEWKKHIPALVGAELIEDAGTDKAPQILAQLGEFSLTYRASGFDFRVDHGAFFQVNRWLIDGLCGQVAADRRGGLAWDLFAGVGLFAKKLAENFERVVAVESAPMASEALKHNLEGGSAHCVIAETAAFLRAQDKMSRPDLVVVDPPRAGLGAETTSLLAEVGAPAIVYVSCDPATLARDLRALLSSGYEISSVTLADLFPQTFHLESVVELRRS
ncbi:MAG TPA: 23S rRNA (uracil(1939)-C(5))-methyltransferase RlmD [Terracidiphilus sp.]|nr:23S rRNA (uracil(1939)-C(5))-methyltransferase RlmD [Terracidiphilus sp.]